MPDVLSQPCQPFSPPIAPRYVATRDHRGYCYCLDVENGLAVSCGSPEFSNPTSCEFAARVAERLNEGRDPACYHWYPMSVDARVEPVTSPSFAEAAL